MLSSTTTYPPASLDIRYFSGDVIYNLIKIFGKEKYYTEQKQKYLGYVSRVFPSITGGEPLINLTCALISIRIRHIKIYRTSNSDSFGYWVIDALHHVKDYNILGEYSRTIMRLRVDEENFIKNLEAEKEKIEEIEEKTEDDEAEEEEEVVYADEDYDDGLPF